MKKLLAALIICGATSSANAQLFYAQGGANLANITKNGDGDTEDNNMLTTFNVGVMGRFGISETIDLESGLLLTGRGSKAETYFNGGADYVKAKFNPLYVELPLNLIINVPTTTSTKLFFNAGPYIAVGVGGKSKLETKVGPLISNSSSDIEFSNDDPFTSGQDDAAYNKLKRFDFGLNAGVGLDLKSFIIKANYGFGLSKINSTESNNSSDDKNKYRTISLSVGIPLSR
ncbi:MAG: PorT family protein [Chitinophagaceae bacterium]|nr:MAG: PorT family protein [Chitinophagaceae bacterium]